MNDCGIELIRSEDLFERGSPPNGSLQFARSAVRNPREVVESVGRPGRGGGDADNREHAVRKQGAAGHGAGPAARVAEDREAADAQLIGKPARIRGCCRDGRAGMRSRPSVTGSVIADPADTKGTRGLEERLGRRTNVRGAVMPQHDQLVRAFCGPTSYA